MLINHEDLVRTVVEERLRDRYAYVYEYDAWRQWDSVRWASVPRHEVRAVIGDWAYAKFRASRDSDERFWSAVCSFESQQALTELAEGHLLRYARDFDRNPLLLNCQNVTVNLGTGEMHEHNPADLITRVTPVAYRPGAGHPDWDQALTALPDGMTDWYQLRMGQAITGRMTPDAKILFQVGTGENGKSGVLDTIRYTLGASADGGYSLLANRSVLASALASSGVNSALASFEGVRLAVVEELADSHFLNATSLKDLADTATISARHPYQRENQFAATHSLFVNSNYLPSIAEVDDGTWRRLKLVRFPYKFSDSAKGTELYRAPDATIKQRLAEGAEQREACLAWLVDGAVRYHAEGGLARFTHYPHTVEMSSREWRAEADQMMLYIMSFLVFDPRYAVRPDDLRNHFNAWFTERGHQPLSAQKFNERFANHTLVTTRNIERDKAMRTNALAKVISYAPGAEPLDTEKAKLHKVWFGFRYRTDDDDVLEAGPVNPGALGRHQWA